VHGGNQQEEYCACVYGGGVVGLTVARIAASLKQSDVTAMDRSTRVDAKETTFEGDFLQGVAACMHASVHFDKCTVKSNTDANVIATDGAVIGLTG
jgi:flavin-dependent dehydrogenase